MDTEINNIINAIARGVSSTALEERLSNLEQSKKELNYDLLLLQSQQTIKKYTKEDIKQQLETYKKTSEIKI